MSLSPEQYGLIKSECEKYVKDVDNYLNKALFFKEELNCYIYNGIKLLGKIEVCIKNLKENSNKLINWQKRIFSLEEKMDDCKKRINKLEDIKITR